MLNPRRYGAMTFADWARYRLSVFAREEAQAIVGDTLAAAPELPQKQGNDAMESWRNEGNPN